MAQSEIRNEYGETAFVQDPAPAADLAEVARLAAAPQQLAEAFLAAEQPALGPAESRLAVGESLLPTGPLVVLVRHAERLDGPDPALSGAGQARARLLASMLADASVGGVYVTEFRRSRETGKPTAIMAGATLIQYAATDSAGLAAAIAAGPSMGAVLVVAHSNTVDDIAAALGVSGVGELAENEFDRMFVLVPGAALRLRYGARAH